MGRSNCSEKWKEGRLKRSLIKLWNQSPKTDLTVTENINVTIKDIDNLMLYLCISFIDKNSFHKISTISIAKSIIS